ncbi:UbiD family decarboxylase associated with menaquinone via futalosine [Acidisarcina polymorpha]|uniref:UbiD family decarboxylase associated with menaquinone via futalosine n=1 Tax=Acidisarcina polymorpha TaxID=2211140 RepID=A0A2Z5G5I9_9BACT|nr:UbiD family decarboxylase [Acidisarcina polymorpha]AXC14368.1 UbiD family decarboxylase associated with menaquinone via futalosine [Acidisarcina polymorpha]
MAHDDLRDFIKVLEKSGELKRIREEVDPILEISEITDRVCKLGKTNGASKHAAGGPALLFEKVKGYPGSRVLMNQFGSERRMKLALHVDSLDEISGRIREFMEVKSPEGMLQKLKMLPMLAEVGKFFPKTIAARDARCKEVVLREKFSVLDFPVLQCWPGDGGRFITLPGVITRDPKSGKRNMGMYRMQVYDGQTTGMHWQRQKIAAEHLRERLREAAAAEAGGNATAAHVTAMAATAGGTQNLGPGNMAFGKLKDARLEVAVVIGTDPETTFSAIVPAPPEVEEFVIAGFLRQKPVELVKCETVDLEVPAHAEIVLEGYVRLDQLRAEGPFGDHTGFYTMQDEYPVFQITCITHRRDPIYAATIVGKPPMEDAWMGKAVERIFLPLMRMTIPEIVDINLPVEGVFHNLMIVSIRKSYAGQARKVMNGIWALGQAMFTKCIIVVDEDCDVQDVGEVTLRVANNIDPERDIQFTLGPIDSLDHASRLPNFGSKMGIDATTKWAAEGFTRPWPAMLEMDRVTRARIDAIWKKLGID